ncbi:sensor histidine kinase [Labilibacter marinus]|uniref:sensor histidine kinase n=1 Tax=Labilibacter marinus TaxID=1477105 RepID=UPI000832D6B0|nr:sensor histidine kinase [Labilibacter marinus]
MRGIATVIWLGLATLIWANPPALKFKYFDKSDGLSSTNMVDIVQDSIGFIWLGTTNGVNRYNGNHFSIYEISHNNTEQYSMRIINDLFIDSKGQLWCASLNTISKYNFHLDIFEYVSADIYTNNIDHTPIVEIGETSNGEIYMIAEHSISYYDDSDGIFKHIKTFDQVITSTQAGHEGEIWLGSSKAPYLFKGNISGNFKSVPLKISYPITYLKLLNDQLFIGSYGGGLLQLNIHNHILKKHINQFSDIKNIASINDDKEGNIWICADSGLYLYNQNTDAFYQYYASTDKYAIKNSVTKFYQDFEGNYWSLHKYGSIGISMFCNKIRTCNNEIEENWYPSSSNTTALHEDKKGNLWLGSYNGGIDIFYWLGNKVKRIHPGSCGLPLGSISMIGQNQHKELEVAVHNNGFYNYNSTLERFTIDHNQQLPPSKNPTHIVAKKAASDGSVWYANHGNGLLQWNEKQFKIYTDKNSNLSNNWVYDITEDQKKNIWVASAWGISKLTAGTDSFKTYFADPNYTNSIPDNEVHCVTSDSYGNIWFGTGRGLAKYNDSKDHFETFLFGKEIKSIVAGEPDVLWLSVSSSIAKFNTKNNTIKYFGIDEGNEVTDFIARSYFKSDKEIFFGGTNGITIFSPEQLSHNTRPPKVAFTGINVFNKAVNFINHPEIISKNIVSAPLISLQYNQNVFSIEFNAVSYNAADKCQYKYKLEGFEEEWMNLKGNLPRVTYTNLEPGKYTFRVKATNNDGLWNEEEATLQIKVIPPWYLRTSFKVLATFFILALVWLLITMRTRRLNKTKLALEGEIMDTTKALISSNNNLQEQTKHLTKLNRELQERQETIEEQGIQLKVQSDKLYQANAELTKINKAKDRLFSVIAHDLQSPFNSILGLSELFHHSYPDLSEEDRIYYAKTINISSTKVYNLLQNLLLWFKSQTKNIELSQLNFKLIDVVRDTIDLLKAVAENKQVSIEFLISEKQMVKGDIDMISTVFRNLISNAIKFSHKGGKVTVNTQVKEGKVLVSIKDEGQGMPPEISDKLFEPENIYSSEGTDGEKGHGLGLVICKEFIDLHQNEIYVESEVGKGSVFHFTIDLC